MGDIRIDYPKHWFVILTLWLEAVFVYIFVTALIQEESPMRTFWLVFAPLLDTVLTIWLLPPILTHHSIADGRLRLRMGLLINKQVDLGSIAQVKETTVVRGSLRIGLGVRYAPISRQLFVTSGFSNTVSLRLREPIEFGVLTKRPVEEIVLNVSYLRGFLEAMQKGMGGTEVV